MANRIENDSTAVIMVGGEGRRARPLTDTTPKPLICVAGHPLLHYLLKRLDRTGFRRAVLLTHYKAEVFRRFCDNFAMNSGDIKVEPCQEPRPMGTAGGLNLVPNLPEDFLVINGDRLTTFDLSRLLCYRTQEDAHMAIAYGYHHYTVPYGTVTIDSGDVTGFEEKPQETWCAFRGAYALSKTVLDLVPDNVAFGFDQLIHACIRHKKYRVVALQTEDDWVSLTTVEDVKLIDAFVRSHRDIFQGDSG